MHVTIWLRMLCSTTSKLLMLIDRNRSLVVLLLHSQSDTFADAVNEQDDASNGSSR
jgi:hypothetical protein